jgi:hypothetical protein
MRAEVLYDIPLADGESLERAVEIVMASELQANLESEAGLTMNMSLRALGKGES